MLGPIRESATPTPTTNRTATAKTYAGGRPERNASRGSARLSRSSRSTVESSADHPSTLSLVGGKPVARWVIRPTGAPGARGTPSREGWEPQGVGHGASLERGVVQVCIPDLIDVGEGARVAIADRDPLHRPVRADPRDLDELVLVLGRQGDPSRRRHPASDTERLGLDLRELRDPRRGEIEQLVQLAPREG